MGPAGGRGQCGSLKAPERERPGVLQRTVLCAMALALALGSCALGEIADRPAKAPAASLACSGRILTLAGLCPDEVKHLSWAQGVKDLPRLTDLSPAALRSVLFATKDMDMASALFYTRAIEDPLTRQYLSYLERARVRWAGKLPDLSKAGLRFVVIPGMFYADNSELGADGRQLRAIATKMGLSSHLLRVDQTGPVDTNAHFLCDYLKTLPAARSVILASVSKSGAEVKRALVLCPSEFTRVRGWLNVAGLLRGSYIVNLLDQNWWLRLKARYYFWRNEYKWAGLQSLARGPHNPLEVPIRLPAELRVVSVVPVPIFRFLTERARPYYHALLHYGPNDGQILLAESYVKGGAIYPSWRNDHYFAFPVPDHVFPATIAYLAGME